MHDDGRVEPRTRLIRPMARETVSLDHFARSHWREAPQREFAPLWEAECARVPEFTESGFHIITGLLLPIWDRLPAENMRVYRFETDDGERVIGRLVTPEALARVYEGLGVTGGVGLAPAEAWSAVLDRGAVLELAGNLQIRRALVMQAWRIELAGFTDGAVPQAEGARADFGDHRLAPAPLRAHRRRSRAGDPRRDLRSSSASARPCSRRGLIGR